MPIQKLTTLQPKIQPTFAIYTYYNNTQKLGEKCPSLCFNRITIKSLCRIMIFVCRSARDAKTRLVLYVAQNKTERTKTPI